MKEEQPERSARVRSSPGWSSSAATNACLKAMLSALLRNAWQFSARRPQVEVEVTGRRTADGLNWPCATTASASTWLCRQAVPTVQRLHGSDEGAGNGIGLSVAQQVAERHGGRIQADAAPDQGATFHVTLHDLQATEAQAA